MVKLMKAAKFQESQRRVPPTQTERWRPEDRAFRIGTAAECTRPDTDNDLRSLVRKVNPDCRSIAARPGGTGSGHVFSSVAGAGGVPAEAMNIAIATIEGHSARMRYIEADECGHEGWPVRIRSTFEVDRMLDAESVCSVFRCHHGWRFEMVWLRHWWEPEP